MKWLRFGTALVTLGIIFGSMGWSIAQKEETLANGKTILLRMAPVDPRSLMQGDYMILGYDQKLFPDEEVTKELPYKGLVVLTLDEISEATFTRIEDGTPLAENEIHVMYRRAEPIWRQSSIRYAANSYFFEEGQGEKYQDAAFVMVAVEPGGKTVLTGLADEAGKRIEETN